MLFIPCIVMYPGHVPLGNIS